MNEIIKHITLDLSRNVNPRVTFAKQLDHMGRQILVSLTDNGKEYPVPNEALVSFNVLRPDGTSGKFSAQITSDGKIIITLTAWILNKSGDVSCTIALHYGDDMKISTPRFIIEVGEEITAENDINDSEGVSLLTSLLSECAGIIGSEKKRIETENSRIDNERTRISYENARLKEETVRKANETKRESNEKIRAEQETERQDNELDRQAVMGNLVEALEGIKKIIDGEVQAALSLAFPVNSVYISFSETSPSTLFGGTWVKLTGHNMVANAWHRVA